MTNTWDDVDSVEIQEWLEALASVLEYEGPERARFIIEQLIENASQSGVQMAGSGALATSYCNSIAADQQPNYPGDIELEKRIEAINRWNAMSMVLRAKKN